MARVDPAYRKSLCSETVSDVGEVRAPMPGVVVDVPVEIGAYVDEGQVLVVEEAMKMQMQLRAPFAGRVEVLQVATGDQVEKGTPLVRIAPEGTAEQEAACPSSSEVSA
jgi:biotin carboxyl carrier protein